MNKHMCHRSVMMKSKVMLIGAGLYKKIFFEERKYKIR